MKISEFANKFNISTDTVRYYMESGLLFPAKDKSYYSFDEQCIKDMNFILEYKNFGFSLNEILKLLMLKRSLNDSDPRFYNYMHKQLQSKKNVLESEIASLNKSISLIDNKSAEYADLGKIDELHPIGMPLMFTRFLQCPRCKSNLMLQDSQIEGNQIFNSHIRCRCGYSAEIIDGTIHTPVEDLEVEGISIKTQNSPYLHSGLSLDKIMNPIYNIDDILLLSYDSYRWMHRKIIDYISNNKDRENFILTTGSNSGKFIYYYLFKKHKNIELFKNTTFIICIPSIEIMEEFKKVIKTFNKYDLNIVLIVGTSEELPIRENSIDLFIDDGSAATYYYRTNNKDSYYTMLKKYKKPKLEVIGYLPDFFYYQLWPTHKHIDIDMLVKVNASNGYKIIDMKKSSLPSRKKSDIDNKRSFIAYHAISTD